MMTKLTLEDGLLIHDRATIAESDIKGLELKETLTRGVLGFVPLIFALLNFVFQIGISVAIATSKDLDQGFQGYFFIVVYSLFCAAVTFLVIGVIVGIFTKFFLARRLVLITPNGNITFRITDKALESGIREQVDGIIRKNASSSLQCAQQDAAGQPATRRELTDPV